MLMMIYSFIIKILIKSSLLLIKDILTVDLDKSNLDTDNNFDEDDLDTIIHARLLAWCSKFKKHKVKKLMAVGFYPKRWWNFWKSKNEKKEMEFFFAA